MRDCAAAFFVLALVFGGPASAAGLDGLAGRWSGTRDGIPITWELRADGRIRIDGRGADCKVFGDSLVVTFDRVDASAPRETALYRFAPEAGASRLFVYGFDLGRQGILLTRELPDLAEDASPPPPAQPAPPPSPPAPSDRPAPGLPGAR